MDLLITLGFGVVLQVTILEPFTEDDWSAAFDGTDQHIAWPYNLNTYVTYRFTPEIDVTDEGSSPFLEEAWVALISHG